MRTYLGVDIGAESGRVVAGRWDGRRLGLEVVHRFGNGPLRMGGALRWDLPGLWEGVRRGLGLASRLGPVASVGVDTWALDYVLTGRDGEMLEPAYCYRDGRTRGMVGELESRLGRSRVFGETGVQFMEINTLCQWMAHARDGSGALERATAMWMVPDWLNWRLSGERSCEFTNATTTQFMDPARRDWARGLLRDLGLPTHALAAPSASGTRLGPLRREIGEDTGLGAVPVVLPATHDTASAVVGVPTSGTGRAGWGYISSGTWSLVGIETGAPVMGEAALAANVTNEGGHAGTWRVLKNVMGLWLVQRCRAALGAGGEELSYESMVESARAAMPWRSLVDPDDAGFLMPDDMATALRGACARTGQPVPGTAGELVRCCLESLALKYARTVRVLEALSGERIEVLHVVGGGSRNGLLNQLTADATGCRVVAGPVEATVLGNILVQMEADGQVAGMAGMRGVGATVEALREHEPGTSGREAAMEAMERWERMFGAHGGAR